MGILGETFVILRDTHSKKILIRRIDQLLDIDIINSNFQIWSNIGWTKIDSIEKSINFNSIYNIESSCGFIKVTSDSISDIMYCNPKFPKINYDRKSKWQLTDDESFLLGYFLKYGKLDNRFNLIITDTDCNCKHLKSFLQIFNKVEGVISNYININGANYVIKNIYDKLIWNKYFNFCYNDQFKKIVPNIILNSSLQVQIAFLLGFLGELNYNKTNPYGYLQNILKTKIITSMSQEVFAGLYIISNNILKNLYIGSFIKNNLDISSRYYYITANSSTNKNDLHITNTNINNTQTFNIIIENPSVNWIAVGIGKFAYKIKNTF